MTKQEILKLLKSNPRHWCKESVQKAIEHVGSFPEGATIAEIAEGIPSAWAYYWARDIGCDYEVMRDRILDSWWAYRWAHDLNRDIKLMHKRVKGSNWEDLWTQNINC